MPTTQANATIAIAVVFAAVTSVATTLALRPDAAPATAAVAELQRTVDELRAGQQQLQQQLLQLDAARAAPAPVQAAVERTAAPLAGEQVAAAVEAYLAQRGAAKAEAAAAGAEGGPAAGFDLETDFATLAAGNYWSNPDAWKRAFAAGRMDDVLKKFAELAKAQPQDVQAQMQYANALFASQQLDPSKWQNSMKADQVLDKVLALDDRHWEARFNKALSYTFYPPFLGKQKDAITHFQKLVAQQEESSPQPHEAQTYLYLGNLLQERDPAQARAIWQKGAMRHPDSQELAKKLAGN